MSFYHSLWRSRRPAQVCSGWAAGGLQCSGAPALLLPPRPRHVYAAGFGLQVKLTPIHSVLSPKYPCTQCSKSLHPHPDSPTSESADTQPPHRFSLPPIPRDKIFSHAGSRKCIGLFFSVKKKFFFTPKKNSVASCQFN